MQIYIIFASTANRLKFVTEFGKSAARGKCHISFATNTETVVAPLIRLDHSLVIIIKTLFASVHRVHVFHNKLAATHDTAFSAQFVAQFVLELINANRQILITLQITAQQLDDWLFVRPAKADISAVLQFRFEPHINQFVTPAASLLPKIFALERAHD